MQFVAQTIIGLEKEAAIEIEELISVKAKKLIPGRLIFDTTEQNAKELIYMTRGLIKVYELRQQLEFTDKEHLVKEIDAGEIEDPFVVRCQRDGEHEFQSIEAEQEIGEKIYESGHKVDLHSPKTTIIVDIMGKKAFVGIDLTPKELSKRDYRIKAHPKSINACLAYLTVRYSGWTKDKKLLDPNCKDGLIPIEAALWACNVPRGYFEKQHYENWDKKIDKQKLDITAADALLPNVRSAEINAKLAEIKKQIDFRKIEIDWLDLKFEKESIDFIITSMDFEDKLFKRAEYLLAKTGKILMISKRPEMASGKFKLVEKLEVMMSKGKYFLLTFKR